MKNILYYAKRYGKKSFDSYPFNEVDGLILSQIAYLNLEHLLPSIDDTTEDVSLLEFLTDDRLETVCADTLDCKRNYKLIKILQKSTRYEGLKINYFSNLFRVEEVKQFCAMTFIFERFMFVAYRGTDITLLGWKENFNMSYLDVIPSQAEAVRYFKRVASKRDLPIYLGGHSKGGNLAVYAAYRCEEALQDRIMHIYDYDGPGVQSNILETKEMQKIKERISKYTCREAMVGILLNHSENMIFVKTKGLSFFQHDSYNWLIKNGKFRYIKNNSIFSKTFEKTTGDFIESSSIEARKRFLDLLFKISMEDTHSTVLEWFKHPIRSIIKMKKRYKKLTPKQRLFLRKMIKKYRLIWRHNFKLFLHTKGGRKNEK